MAVIYRITNMANGKFYIGSAESFARREWQHRYDLKRNTHKNPHLQASWNKHGEEMFVFEVVEEIPEGEEQLAWEDKWLCDCVGKPDCYNVNTLATAPRLGLTLSEESRAQLSINRKGKAAGKDHYRYGQIVNDEVRQKIGDAQRGKSKSPGRKVSEAGKAKIRANIEAGRSHMHWLGRTHTEEAKQKMRKQVLEQTSGQIFDSLTAVLAHYQMNMPTLRRALVSGKPITKGKFVGLVFVYA